jgi:hypothetical protein
VFGQQLLAAAAAAGLLLLLLLLRVLPVHRVTTRIMLLVTILTAALHTL